ncbi:hypothetical protein KQI42_17450 [Tissierella sp. MSJ-40]|uniref:Thoeris protein ThsA Macro domain-containing protein n=1 Tax=Tissierella simiarum TaxID=2841534 RepID=A0ABS6EA50_9FIRM|nr:macro domain-containing protein [Tissierella simiarum]MBU5439805.1 hypothetical protein [Tissierella simiarum]
MKIKIDLWNKVILEKFFWFLTVVSTILSIVLIVIDIDKENKFKIGIYGLIIFAVVYLGIWVYENFRDNIKININNSQLHIKVGDIFSEEGLKVIGVNEYFDNIVDNVIISEYSLHGQYIKNHYKDTTDIDKRIETDLHLIESKSDYNAKRKIGKKQKYKLGSIFADGEYLLTAFAKFDDKNRAFLYMNDYINFLLNFWNEIDIIYSGRSVTIPLFGSGITRFKEYDHISDQELLELLIWSFKLSRIKFKYPAKATIVIHKDKADKINFTKLKEWE